MPKARGEVSEAVFAALRDPDRGCQVPLGVRVDDPEDLHIALWALYELHYQGFDDADEDLEWHPDLLRVRLALERRFEADLRSRYVAPTGAEDFASSFFDYVAAFDGPSLASYVKGRADRQQVLDLLRLKSIYHLKESDPTSWLVPRLPPAAKAGLVELLFDEYGAGDPNQLHAHLFAKGLEASGLSGAYGAYIDEASLEVLEDSNAMSMFGLNRRLRAAALGHLAAFEATSSLPSRRMAQGLARLSFPREMIDYYEEHVEADAVHEQLAVRVICAAVLAHEPYLRDDLFFGAFTSLDLADRFARRMLGQWGVSA
ncbi:iron-containing redox enzyme family protein [Nocardioides sp.]|uniref:iron-containing redox enzyme family protein n=1 Tax=Nocardioides sp. TaxID=35761 RepID=UPI003D0FE01C